MPLGALGAWLRGGPREPPTGAPHGGQRAAGPTQAGGAGGAVHDMAKGAPTSMQTPARVFDVELSEPLPLIDSPVRPDGSRYGGALVLIRLHGQPLGTLELDLSGGGARPPPVGPAALAD